MIRSFRSGALRRFMERGEERRIAPSHRDAVRDILARLNASAGPDDMDLPGFRLHPLNVGYTGQVDLRQARNRGSEWLSIPSYPT